MAGNKCGHVIDSVMPKPTLLEELELEFGVTPPSAESAPAESASAESAGAQSAAATRSRSRTSAVHAGLPQQVPNYVRARLTRDQNNNLENDLPATRPPSSSQPAIKSGGKGVRGKGKVVARGDSRVDPDAHTDPEYPPEYAIGGGEEASPAKKPRKDKPGPYHVAKNHPVAAKKRPAAAVMPPLPLYIPCLSVRLKLVF